MTSKEFEVMRNAQKHETKLAIIRELESIKAEIKVDIYKKIHDGYGTASSICDDIMEIIDEHEERTDECN